MANNQDNAAVKENGWYKGLTQFLSSNTISVIVALLSGIAINLYTNENSNWRYAIPIVLLILAVICLVLLWRINENFHDSFASNLNNEKRRLTSSTTEPSPTPKIFPKSDAELWAGAIKNERSKYLLYLVLAVVLVVISIACIGITNSSIVAEAKQERETLQSTMTMISEQVVAIQTKVTTQEAEIKKLSESIQQISTHAVAIEEGNLRQKQ